MNKAIGSFLPFIGRIFTPAAMVVFLTYEISRSQAVDGWWQLAVVIGAAATAVGVEVVGILSGHALEGFWRVGDTTRAAVAFILLLIYTAAGIVILRGNPTLLPIPIIAAVLYIVAALVDGLETAVTRQSGNDAAQEAFERDQKALDRETARQIRLKDQEAKTAVSLAKVEAKSASSGQDKRQDKRQDAGILPNELGMIPADWRQVSKRQRSDLAHMTREERAEIMPDLSKRAQTDWHNRLDEIAAQNGGYKV